MRSISFEMIGVVILTIVLAGVLVAYDRVLKKLQRVHHETGKTEEEAQRKAERIMEEARIKATEILSEAKLNGEKLQAQLAEMVDTIDQGHIGEYKEKLQKISEDIEKSLERETGEFRKVLELETIDAQKTATAKVEEEYAQLHKQLEEYKQKRLAEMEAGLAQALEAGLKKYTGEMFTAQIQQELIIKAIEEAKNKNVFERG